MRISALARYACGCSTKDAQAPNLRRYTPEPGRPGWGFDPGQDALSTLKWLTNWLNSRNATRDWPELESEATAPRLKRYLCSLIEECERMAGEGEAGS
jgi:hypothetical protein